MQATAGKTAADVMRREVITVRDCWDVREALRIFEQEKISGAPVIDKDGDLVGVLSLTDIAKLQSVRARRPAEDSDYYRTTILDELPAGFHYEAYEAVPVAEVMTPLVIDAPEDMSISRLATLMIDLHIHRVIITRNGALAGIVSSLDLLKVLKNGG